MPPVDRAERRRSSQFPKRPKRRHRPAESACQAARATVATSRCSCGPTRSTTTTPTSASSAVGNVQIYYNGSTLEADKVIYDQKTKRLHAEGNVRLTEPDGQRHLRRDPRISATTSATASSIRCASTRPSRPASPPPAPTAAAATSRSSRAASIPPASPARTIRRKPPKWQVKAARIIHDQGEKMIYFEDARLEFFGVPLAYLPVLLGARSDREAQDRLPDADLRHQLAATASASTTPYYWALAPNYDLTLTPMFTTQQGPLVQGEWRQRLMNGAYTIRASGIFQLDKDVFSTTARRAIATSAAASRSTGQFRLNRQLGLGLGRHADHRQDLLPGLRLLSDRATRRSAAVDARLRHVAGLPHGRGDRSFFDVRAMYFYGFSSVDDQKQIPIIHPVIDYDYMFGQPILGGELSFSSNLTSLTAQAADFDAITPAATSTALCAITSADPASRRRNNCLLRGVPGTYTRVSAEANWRRTIIDPFGQMFTPFVSARGDVASVDITDDAGRVNFITTGQNRGRAVHADRRPRISLSLHQRAVLGHADHRADRADHRAAERDQHRHAAERRRAEPHLRRQQPVPRQQVLGLGPRRRRRPANVGVQYTAQFNRGGFVNVLFGQSYHLFGQNSFAVGGPTNTGLDSGLDNAAFRLRGAGRLPAELAAHAHVALPLRRGRLHAAALRIRSDASISTAGRPRSCTATTRRSRRSASWTGAKASSATARFKVSPELA